MALDTHNVLGYKGETYGRQRFDLLAYVLPAYVVVGEVKAGNIFFIFNVLSFFDCISCRWIDCESLQPSPHMTAMVDWASKNNFPYFTAC